MIIALTLGSDDVNDVDVRLDAAMGYEWNYHFPSFESLIVDETLLHVLRRNVNWILHCYCYVWYWRFFDVLSFWMMLLTNINVNFYVE